MKNSKAITKTDFVRNYNRILREADKEKKALKKEFLKNRKYKNGFVFKHTNITYTIKAAFVYVWLGAENRIDMAQIMYDVQAMIGSKKIKVNTMTETTINSIVTKMQSKKK